MNYLDGCQSKPKLLGELKTGALFIFFPIDGDDSGHGGFKGKHRLKRKIDNVFPGGIYAKSFCYSHEPYGGGELESGSLNVPVIEITLD